MRLGKPSPMFRRSSSPDRPRAKFADSRCDVALAFLCDDRLPRATVDSEGDRMTVVYFKLVSNMSLFNILTDSIDGLSEAATMWSKARLAESTSKVGRWWDDAEKLLITVDQALIAHLFSVITDSGLLGKLKDLDKLEGAAWSTAVGQLAGLCVRVHE